MRHCAAALIVVSAGVLGALAQPGEAPKPNIVPVSWQLEFTHEQPRPITLRTAGAKQARTYWYVLYQVANRTGDDRIFVPEFVLYTDTGEVLRAGAGVPTAVFTAVQKRHNNPLLKNLADITGRLLQGADNAKDGVAIWTDFDPAARGFDIFAGGLSGERAKVKLPAPVMVEEKDAEGKVRQVARNEVILAKTLQLTYDLPGEAPARPSIAPELVAKKWVMR